MHNPYSRDYKTAFNVLIDITLRRPPFHLFSALPAIILNYDYTSTSLLLDMAGFSCICRLKLATVLYCMAVDSFKRQSSILGSTWALG